MVIALAVVALAGPAASLHPAYPNPFNPTTAIPWELGSSARVELAIFDGKGKRVRTLVEGARDAGRYRTLWNGTDERGRTVAGGVYFCRLWTDTGAVQVIRLILLK